MKTYQDCGGYLAFKTFYEHMATCLPDGCRIAEVGVFQGKSAIFLASRLKELGKDFRFFAIDPWTGTPEDQTADNNALFESFISNLIECGIESHIVPMRMTSVRAAVEFPDGYFDFVFIDARHDYESVKEDISLWLPNVKPGGILAGDDYITLHPGVIQAVDEAFGERVHKDHLPAWWVSV